MSESDLVQIVQSSMDSGDQGHHDAQNQVAGELFRQRINSGTPGDALGDWVEAARLLNQTAYAHDLDVAHW